jgi:hypothetical protein
VACRLLVLVVLSQATHSGERGYRWLTVRDDGVQTWNHSRSQGPSLPCQLRPTDQSYTDAWGADRFLYLTPDPPPRSLCVNHVSSDSGVLDYLAVATPLYQHVPYVYIWCCVPTRDKSQTIYPSLQSVLSRFQLTLWLETPSSQRLPRLVPEHRYCINGTDTAVGAGNGPLFKPPALPCRAHSG